jgi:hypothetical protein
MGVACYRGSVSCNRVTHVLQFDQLFSDYCCKMKGMVDELHSLDEELPDYHLVFHLLREYLAPHLEAPLQ